MFHKFDPSQMRVLGPDPYRPTCNVTVCQGCGYHERYYNYALGAYRYICWAHFMPEYDVLESYTKRNIPLGCPRFMETLVMEQPADVR